MQIDVEGYDGEVLKMIDFDVIKPKIIKYEHGCIDKGEQLQLHELLRSEHYDYFTQGNDTIAIYSAGT